MEHLMVALMNEEAINNLPNEEVINDLSTQKATPHHKVFHCRHEGCEKTFPYSSSCARHERLVAHRNCSQSCGACKTIASNDEKKRSKKARVDPEDGGGILDEEKQAQELRKVCQVLRKLLREGTAEQKMLAKVQWSKLCFAWAGFSILRGFDR